MVRKLHVSGGVCLEDGSVVGVGVGARVCGFRLCLCLGLGLGLGRRAYGGVVLLFLVPLFSFFAVFFLWTLLSSRGRKSYVPNERR